MSFHAVTQYGPESAKPVHRYPQVQHLSCAVCGDESHKIYTCPQFLALSVADRRATISKYRLCFNCLGRNHPSDTCLSRSSCAMCNKRHHSLLHETFFQQQVPVSHPRNESLYPFPPPNLAAGNGTIKKQQLGQSS